MRSHSRTFTQTERQHVQTAETERSHATTTSTAKPPDRHVRRTKYPPPSRQAAKGPNQLKYPPFTSDLIVNSVSSQVQSQVHNISSHKTLRDPTWPMTHCLLKTINLRLSYTVITSILLVWLASRQRWIKSTSTMPIETTREVTYKARQGSVTCHDLLSTNKCRLSRDKWTTSHGPGIHEMGTHEVATQMSLGRHRWSSKSSQGAMQTHWANNAAEQHRNTQHWQFEKLQIHRNQWKERHPCNENTNMQWTTQVMQYRKEKRKKNVAVRCSSTG